MTLIVGILCSDGVVLASDSTATFGPADAFTIRQSVTKLRMLSSKMLVGYAGAVGISQVFDYMFSEAWKRKDFADKASIQWMQIASTLIVNNTSIMRQVVQQGANIVSMTARLETICHTLLAGDAKDGPFLVRFNEIGAGEMATKDLPFVAIGSGQPIADPFLAFVRRVFWPDRLPTLAEGTFAACWTLDHAIETHPGGVGGNIQMGVIEKVGGAHTARLYDGDTCGEHRQDVKQIEQYLSTYRRPETASDVPDPPIAQMP